MSEKVKPTDSDCLSDSEIEATGLRYCNRPDKKVKPKQRRRRVNTKKMAQFMVVVAVDGYAPVGKIEVDLKKCAIYELQEASE